MFEDVNFLNSCYLRYYLRNICISQIIRLEVGLTTQNGVVY